MAKKTRQHHIDDAAKQVLKDILNAVSWNVELSPEYGIDFRVQMLDGEAVSWRVFLVQLKGHERLVRTKKAGEVYVTHSLGTDRLRDYFEVYREPVFLIVVDTSSKEARYLFVQEYASNGLLSRTWQKQKSVTLYIPEQNDLRDQGRFRADLNASLRYMNDRYPGSVPAAIRHAEDAYREMDPRLDVRCEIKDGKPVFHFLARGDVQPHFKINASGHDGPARVDRLIKTGLPTEFARDEITFVDSPVLDREMPAGPLTVQWGKTREMFFSLICVDSAGQETARLDGMRGKLTAGGEVYHFRAEMPSGPLTVQADNLAYSSSPANLSMSFAISRWDGMPIRDLPGLDQLVGVFRSHTGSRFQFQIVLLDSGQTMRFDLHDFHREVLDGVVETLEDVRKLREIATIAGVEPRFKAALTPELLKDARRVHAILTEGKLVTPKAKVRVSMRVPRMHVEQVLRNEKADDLTITQPEQLDFYAEPLAFGCCTRTFTHMRLANAASIRAQIEKRQVRHVTAAFEGQEDTVMIERINPKAVFSGG
jgi:hypothetical protein